MISFEHGYVEGKNRSVEGVIFCRVSILRATGIEEKYRERQTFNHIPDANVMACHHF